MTKQEFKEAIAKIFTSTKVSIMADINHLIDREYPDIPESSIIISRQRERITELEQSNEKLQTALHDSISRIEKIQGENIDVETALKVAVFNIKKLQDQLSKTIPRPLVENLRNAIHHSLQNPVVHTSTILNWVNEVLRVIWPADPKSPDNIMDFDANPNRANKHYGALDIMHNADSPAKEAHGHGLGYEMNLGDYPIGNSASKFDQFAESPIPHLHTQPRKEDSLTEAAEKVIYSDNIQRNIKDGYCTSAAQDAFMAGAEWQEKRSQSFTGRESLNNMTVLQEVAKSAMAALIAPFTQPPNNPEYFKEVSNQAWDHAESFLTIGKRRGHA